MIYFIGNNINNHVSATVLLGRVVRREQSSSIAIDRTKKKKNPQNQRCPVCKSSSIAIELTFAPPQINKIPITIFGVNT